MVFLIMFSIWVFEDLVGLIGLFILNSIVKEIIDNKIKRKKVDLK